MQTFFIDGEQVSFTLSRSVTRKTVCIRMDSDLGFEIVAPKKLKVSPERIISENLSWIRKRLYETRFVRNVLDSGKVLYMGRLYGVEVFSGTSNSILGLTDGKLRISCPNGKDPKTALKKWLQKETRRYLDEYLPIYSRALDVSYNRVFLRDTSSRWASCSCRKNLNFNWKAICLPESLFRYLMVHELSHIREFNHSSGFWKVVESIFPDHRALRKELKCYLPGTDFLKSVSFDQGVY